MLKIYITDLQAYNEGHFSLPLSNFELSQAISEVLSEGETISGTDNHEEYFITDYEWENGGIFDVGEYENIHDLNQLLNLMEELTSDDLLKLKFLVYEGYEAREVINQGIDTYEVDIYDYSASTSFTDVYEMLAYDLVDEGCFGVIPEHLTNYIDYSAIGLDLSQDYTEFEHGILGRVA